MTYQIVRIDESNYGLFDHMIFFRMNGFDSSTLNSSTLVSSTSDIPTSQVPLQDSIKKELANPNLYIYAARAEQRLVGWISLVYIPKVGKWQGHGHVYVDELWVEPKYRGQGLAKALLGKADELKVDLKATGIRLYVNVENDTAHKLYEACGYEEDGQAIYMEKQ